MLQAVLCQLCWIKMVLSWLNTNQSFCRCMMPCLSNSTKSTLTRKSSLWALSHQRNWSQVATRSWLLHRSKASSPFLWTAYHMSWQEKQHWRVWQISLWVRQATANNKALWLYHCKVFHSTCLRCSNYSISPRGSCSLTLWGAWKLWPGDTVHSSSKT